MLLKGRNAIVYGGGGSVGGAVARAFGREGARVFLAGRTPATLERVAGQIRAAGGAVEAMRRQLAAELGPYGIRVVTLRTGGLPETIPADLDQREAIERDIVGQTLTGRAASLEDVGNVAVFAASDLARTMTGTAINITCGAVPD
ncbi:SDR family oxidoreductase [Streptosporangium sp. NPDC023963]|uniref:SDR family oxidoreductase n=1 Tax=Streptosporangium sp. NPDC023963 TaxID=3155608 RepID=UPI003445F3D1